MNKILLSALAFFSLATASAASVPYTQSFDTSADFATLTLYHADTDTRDWDYSSSAARFYPASRYNAFDAWFFLPGLDLEAGKQYVVTFDAKISSSGSSNYKTISLNIGTAATVDTQKELFSKEIQSTSPQNQKVNLQVEAAGTYYLGFRTKASSSSMNDILVDNIKVEEYKELPGVVTDVTATPGEKGALEVNLTWTNPAVNDGGTALSQLSGVVIKRTDSSWVSAANATEVATVTEGIAVGEVSTFTDNTVEKSGTYYYYIVPFNENGQCPLSIEKTKTAYVGPDTGLSATKGVVATPDPDNEKSISLTWDVPSGTNGGYVDPDAVKWKITRKGPATVVLAEEWTGTAPYNFVDNSITELGAYTYTVQYVTADKTESTGGTSNKVVTGGVASLPFEQNFASTSSLDLFTCFSGDKSDYTWVLSTYYGSVQLNQGSNSGEMDAWLVTPAFELEAGKYYELSFDVWSTMNNSPKSLEVMLGNGKTVADLTTSLFDETLQLTSSAVTKTLRFKAGSDGRFYIGFHAKGASSQGYFKLSNIKFDEKVVAPAAATDFTATADPDGAFSVALAWTNPSLDNVGNELTAITKLEVLRGEEVIKTYEPATPGEAMTCTDEVTAPGRYTYHIVAYQGENAGESANATTGKVGGSMELPYTADFTSAATFEDWTMPADGNYSWKFEPNYNRLKSDDHGGLWLYTPEFKAKKGEVTLTLNGAAHSSSYSETIYVSLYKTPEAGAEAQSNTVVYTFKSTTKTNAEFALEVPEAGNYVIGISRPSSGWYLYLYGATIEQTSAVNENAPLAVTDLTVSADDQNEHLVHLYWTIPTKNEGGNDLTEITKIEIYRDDALIETLTKQLVPGESTGYDDTVETSGFYTYSLIVYSGENASKPATAKSPLIGGGLELPYEVEITSADAVELWTLPQNASGKAWTFEASSSNPFPTCLKAGYNNMKAFTAPLKAKKGTVSVTFTCASYNSRYEETIKVGLVTAPSLDAEPVGEWQSKTVASSYSVTDTFEFDVPEAGTYYVCFYLETSKMYFYLSSVLVEQSSVAVENIIVLWDNTDAKFGKPVVNAGGDDIEMLPYQPGTLAVAETDNSPVEQTNVFMAQIPGNAASVTFKDGDNTEAVTYPYDEPKHLWIYSATGAKEFDPNDVTGIEDVEADSNAPARYYDLSGTEVASPVSGKVYIVVRGAKAVKQVVK